MTKIKRARFDVTSEGDVTPFLELLLPDWGSIKPITAWQKTDENHLLLNSSKNLEGDHRWTPLPVALDVFSAAEMVNGYLRAVEYPKQPLTDGSVHKGWRIVSGPGGFASSSWDIEVRPVWIVYGK